METAHGTWYAWGNTKSTLVSYVMQARQQLRNVYQVYDTYIDMYIPVIAVVADALVCCVAVSGWETRNDHGRKRKILEQEAKRKERKDKTTRK